jgi:DNA-binding transcriptional LysR family regulator
MRSSREIEEIVTAGANYGATATLLPGLIARFRENHPVAKLNLYTDNSQEIETLLTNGKIDIGITISRKRIASFAMEPFRTVRLCAFVASDHPLVQDKRLRAKQVAHSWPIAILGQEERLRTIVLLKRLREIGASTDILIRCGSPDAVKMATINSGAIGILHSDVIHREVQRKQLAPLNVSTSDLDAHTYLIYSKKKSLSAPTQHELEMLRQTRQIHPTLASTAQKLAILLGIVLLSSI